MKKEKVDTKSPIEDKPLRYPAQSLDEKIDDLIGEKSFTYIIIPALFIMLAFGSWISYFGQTIPNPIIFTIMALLSIIWAIYQIIKFRKEIKSLKQGRDGEREVGMNLELLREQGFKVYHDIVAKDFNLDHILIGTQGIFVIETKTYSKPLKGECRIIYDGEKLSYNGTFESDKPIIQAKAGAHWLKNQLRASTGKDFNVQPIVVFPGWFTESKVPQKDIWILNPKGLDKFMRNSKVSLNIEDIALITNRIEIYIRNCEYK
ncbi:nuclease-related domain-containing protein [Sulfurospirillum sp.]|uniref:nuclease-related domain-containing protein n=1 Tax=Sulfurospirillum sp. TaxID=2053622 RepID=UPI002FDCABBA